MLGLVIIPFRSSEVDSGEGSDAIRGGAEGADGVRRCFVRYDADRGRAGLELVVGEWWKDGLRLTSGDDGAVEAGERADGGVYGILGDLRMSVTLCCGQDAVVRAIRTSSCTTVERPPEWFEGGQKRGKMERSKRLQP